MNLNAKCSLLVFGVPSCFSFLLISWVTCEGFFRKQNKSFKWQFPFTFDITDVLYATFCLVH